MNIQEKIEQAIEDGPGSETTLDDETLHEIARRWLADARHRRERDTQKRAERTTFKDRPEVRRVMSEGIFELTLRMTERFANEYTEEFLAKKLGYANPRLQFNFSTMTVRNIARVDRLYRELTT